MGLVEHINNEVAHGDHVIPSAGRSEIELVQACEHDVATECLNFLLIDMLARLLVYHASGKPKVDQIYCTFLKHVSVVVDHMRIWELVISLDHEVVKLQIVEY